jgi:hypothetical protein
MMYQVLKTTEENPSKNYFVQTCLKYLKTLDIDLTFEQISKMSKQKISALKYLNTEKATQSKKFNIDHQKLVMQEYLLDSDRNLKVPKLIFKARSKTLDIKTQKRWKYEDLLCSGCMVNEESGDEILFCKMFGENSDIITYSWFYSESAQKQVDAAKLMMVKLERRKRIREEVT